MEKKLRPIHGLILFAVYCLFMLTIGAVLQHKMGLGGIAITEFCLLGMAVLFPRMLGVELKTVFDLTPPPISKFFGSAALGFGVLLATNSVDMLLAYFFPGILESNQGVTDLIASGSPLLAVIVVAILPAICEEMLFRGTLMSSFRALNRPWLIALVVGLLFGIGHFDIYRLIATGALGAAFAYIGIKTGSIFLGCLLHFIINIFSVVASHTGNGESAESLLKYSLPAIAGSAVVYLAFALFLFVLGKTILDGKRFTHKLYLKTACPASLIFLIGITLTAFGADMTLLQSLGSTCLYAAITATVLLIGWIILARRKPSKAMIALVCVFALLTFSTGSFLSIIGAEPPVYSAQISLNAAKTEVTETFNIEEEGIYLLLVSARSVGSTIRVTISVPEDTPEPEQKGTSIATFEGEYFYGQPRQILLKPGTYTVRTAIKEHDGVKDREIEALAIISLRKVANITESS